VLQQKNESEHVRAFSDNYERVLTDYLNTEDGLIEVNHLRVDLGNSRKQSIENNGVESTNKWNIKSLFGKKIIIDPFSLVSKQEAFDLILEADLKHIETDAFDEYRKAHPPRFPCSQCRNTFTSPLDLEEHEREGDEFHAEVRVCSQ
jgi:hypothetical protein